MKRLSGNGEEQTCRNCEYRVGDDCHFNAPTLGGWPKADSWCREWRLEGVSIREAELIGLTNNYDETG